MAWIRMIDESEAGERLRALYAQLTSSWGGVDHIIKIHSLNPPSMETHHRFYATLMRGRSPLSRIQREMIAVVVSAANRCHY